MSDDEIVWAAPPEHAHFSGASAPGRYMKFATLLKQNPQQWAKLPSQAGSAAGAKNTAANIRTGKIKGFTPKGQWETAVDELTIYVRYVGPPGGGNGAVEDEDPENGDSENGYGDGEDRSPILALAPRVREWALASGIDVPERGRLPRQLIEAYQRAQQ